MVAATETPTRDPSPMDVDEHAFAAALVDALGEMTQQALADRLGLTRASVNDWCRARSIPSPHTVFAIEEALGLAEGELSRILGYLPLSCEGQPPGGGTVRAMGVDRYLTDEQRSLLIMIYEQMAGRRPRSTK